MRFRAFPISVVVDGVVREPAMLWATDEATQVYVERGDPIATFAGCVSRSRAHDEFLEGTERKAKFVIALTDDTTLLIGNTPGCGCSHPLKSWVPPPKVDA